MQTSKAGIYAIGDITGKFQLAHVASAQGIVAAENIAGRPSRMHYDSVPSCVYTIPEIASVGMTEKAAVEAGYEVISGKFPMAASGRAKAAGASEGFVKIVAYKSDGRILGACIIGPNATEVIGELAYAIRHGGTPDDIKHTIHAHPTISETILEAAHVATGEPIHIK
jgi:dihydrolipoamide dehydrogenase